MEFYAQTFETFAPLETAAQMPNHVSTRTTQLYAQRREELSLDEVERIECNDLGVKPMKLTPENLDYEDCRPLRKVRGILLPRHLWEHLDEEDRAEQEEPAAHVDGAPSAVPTDGT